VHVEDRQEDPDTAHSYFQNVSFFDFDNVFHRPIGRCDDSVWIGWNLSIRIAKKEKREKYQE